MLSASVNTLYATESSLSSAAHPSKAATNEQTIMPATAHKNPAHEPQQRKLSSFFKLGIAINIAMIFTFLWWASRQWRMTSKNKDP